MPSGFSRQALPDEFVRAMGHLYPGRELLWWVIAEQSVGDVVAASDVRRLVWTGAR